MNEKQKLEKIIGIDEKSIKLLQSVDTRGVGVFFSWRGLVYGAIRHAKEILEDYKVRLEKRKKIDQDIEKIKQAYPDRVNEDGEFTQEFENRIKSLHWYGRAVDGSEIGGDDLRMHYDSGYQLNHFIGNMIYRISPLITVKDFSEAGVISLEDRSKILEEEGFKSDLFEESLAIMRDYIKAVSIYTLDKVTEIEKVKEKGHIGPSRLLRPGWVGRGEIDDSMIKALQNEKKEAIGVMRELPAIMEYAEIEPEYIEQFKEQAKKYLE